MTTMVSLWRNDGDCHRPLVSSSFSCAGVGDPAVDDEVPAPGHDHHLVDLGDRHEFVEDAVERGALGDLQADDEPEGTADERLLDHDRVAADDAGFLEARHPLADRAGGDTEPSGDGARRQSGVLAEHVDDLTVEVVERQP